ncbi:HET-domain-containing protein, partial [Hyaloscypha variabilis F]
LDADLIKSWISKCLANHNSCKEKLSISDLHTHVRPKFIDVFTNRLVGGDTVTDYVALSYVWSPSQPEPQCKHGGTSGGELVMSRIPDGEPPMYALRNSEQLVFSHPCQAVKDAMELVKKIGFRYLWVDEYCIGDSAREKEIHISQMDRIYEGAVLTICALSGTHKHIGLPGMSLPLQVAPQPYLDLDSTRIVATRLPSPLHDASESPWNERAWTLQEASLSRRLLCFTEESVFWVCQEE